MATRTARQEKVLKIVDGEVVPEIVKRDDPEGVEGETASGALSITFDTPAGKAVYEYVGDCSDCANKRPPEKSEVFVCVTHPVRADEQVGASLAAFRKDGSRATPLCQNCYRKWVESQPKDVIRYKVLEK